MLMAVAIIMDMLGRMAKKRVAEQQDPAREDWDMPKALADDADELPEPGATEALPPGREQVIGGFELWSEAPSPRPGAPGSVKRGPVIERVEREPALRDRAARPVVVRSRDPRPVEPRPERAGTGDELVVRARQLPAPARLAAPRAARPRRARGADAEDRLGLGTLRGVRHAIVAREVLGPPIALREGDDVRGGRR